MSVNMYQSSLKLHGQIQVGPYAWPYSSHPLSSVNLEEELSLFFSIFPCLSFLLRVILSIYGLSEININCFHVRKYNL